VRAAVAFCATTKVLLTARRLPFNSPVRVRRVQRRTWFQITGSASVIFFRGACPLREMIGSAITDYTRRSSIRQHLHSSRSKRTENVSHSGIRGEVSTPSTEYPYRTIPDADTRARNRPPSVPFSMHLRFGEMQSAFSEAIGIAHAHACHRNDPLRVFRKFSPSPPLSQTPGPPLGSDRARGKSFRRSGAIDERELSKSSRDHDRIGG